MSGAADPKLILRVEPVPCKKEPKPVNAVVAVIIPLLVKVIRVATVIVPALIVPPLLNAPLTVRVVGANVPVLLYELAAAKVRLVIVTVWVPPIVLAAPLSVKRPEPEVKVAALLVKFPVIE